MKKYDYKTLKSVQITLRNASERRDSWWKVWARYAEIAKRKLWKIEIGLLACLILMLSSCQTAKGITGDSAWILQKLSDNVQVQQEK